MAITVRKLDPDSGDFRPVLKEIRDRLETRIIVDCNTKLVKQILREVRRIVSIFVSQSRWTH
jgi:hypothetical protein